MAKKAASTTRDATTTAARAPRSSVPRKATATAATTSAESVELIASFDQIAAKAYEIYCERCRTGCPGDAHGDWVAAEAALRNGGAH